jgi:hypothetical protein
LLHSKHDDIVSRVGRKEIINLGKFIWCVFRLSAALISLLPGYAFNLGRNKFAEHENLQIYLREQEKRMKGITGSGQKVMVI